MPDSGYDKNGFDPEELRQELMAVCLTTGQGAMGVVLQQVLNAKEYNQEIVLLYRHVPVMDISKAVTATGVRCHTKWEVGRIAKDDEYSDIPTDALRTSIPGMAERSYDFELLLPFYIAKQIQGLGLSHRADSIEVDGLFVLALKHLLRTGEYTMDYLVKQGILDAADNTVVDLQSLLTSRSRSSFYDALRMLNPVVLLYLGMDLGFGDKIIPVSEDELAHPMSGTALKKTAAMLAVTGQPLGRLRIVDHSPYPRFVRCARVAAQDAGLLARNIEYLECIDPRSAEEKVLRCLVARLFGCPETTIRKLLNFRNRTQYEKWLAENHIGLAITKWDSVLKADALVEQWKRACDSLFASHAELKSEPLEILVREPHDINEEEKIHAATTPVYSLKSPWAFSDIRLRLLEDDKYIRVYTPGQTEGRKVSYAELGMAHERTGEPIDLWVYFLNCIENDGRLPQLPKGPKKGKNRMKSLKHRMKKKLCAAFGTDEDPFCSLTDGTGYRLKCRIEEKQHSDRLSFESEKKTDIETIDGKQKLPYGLPKNTRHRENDE